VVGAGLPPAGGGVTCRMISSMSASKLFVRGGTALNEATKDASCRTAGAISQDRSSCHSSSP